MARSCSWCGEPLPEDAIGHVHLHSGCKAAKDVVRATEWAEKNRDRRRAYNREWMRRYRTQRIVVSEN